jgi:hypothetical protein
MIVTNKDEMIRIKREPSQRRVCGHLFLEDDCLPVPARHFLGKRLFVAIEYKNDARCVVLFKHLIL